MKVIFILLKITFIDKSQIFKNNKLQSISIIIDEKISIFNYIIFCNLNNSIMMSSFCINWSLLSDDLAGIIIEDGFMSPFSFSKRSNGDTPKFAQIFSKVSTLIVCFFNM